MSRRAMMVKVGAGGGSGSYYITRTIDHTKLASEDRTDDLVFIVDITLAVLKTVGNGGHVIDGNDIHVTDNVTGTTEWTFTKIAYAATTGHLVLAIKPPSTTSSSSDRTYRIAYGDSSITSSLSNSANTFPTSIFEFAHGFDDDGSGGVVVTDRSAHGRNATNHNGATLDTSAGLVNGGAAFARASSQYFSIPFFGSSRPDATHPKLILATVITGSSFPAFMALLSVQSSAANWYGFAIDSSGHPYGYANFQNGNIDCVGVTALSTSTRYTLAFYLGIATNGAKVFINGTRDQQVNAAYTNNVDSPDTIIGGDTDNSGRWFNGTIGEIWQITDTRSEAFVTTYSNALYDPSTFSTGTTETAV